VQAPDEGVEIGIEKASWTAQLAISNGTAGAREVDKGKLAVARAEFVQSAWRVGASAGFNDADAGNRRMVGLFGAYRAGPVVLIGEIDYIDDDSIGVGGRKLAANLA